MSPSIPAANQIDNVAPADSLPTGAGKYNTHYHGYDSVEMTNRTGVQLVTGDVVALDTANDTSVVTSDVQGSKAKFFVAAATINNGVNGEFVRSGRIFAKAVAGISRGHYVRKSATAKAIETMSITVGSGTAMPDGAIGVAEAADSGGLCIIMLFPFTVTVPVIQAVPTAWNFLHNGSFELWATTAGQDDALSWTGSGAGVLVREAANVIHGTASLKITGSVGGVRGTQDVNALGIQGPIGWWRNQQVTAGAWVWCASATRARLNLNDGLTVTNGTYHTGSSTYEWLTVTKTLAGGATKVEVQCEVIGGVVIGYFDGVTLVQGGVLTNALPVSVFTRRTFVMPFSSGSLTIPAGTPYYLMLADFLAAASSGQVIPVKAVARNMFVSLDRVMAAGSLTARLYVNGASTIITCTVANGTSGASDLTHAVVVPGQAVLAVEVSTPGGSTTPAVYVTIEFEAVP